MVSKSNKYNPASPRQATIYNQRYIKNPNDRNIYKGLVLSPKSQERSMEDIEASNHKNSIKRMEEETRNHLQEIRPSQRQLKKQKKHTEKTTEILQNL